MTTILALLSTGIGKWLAGAAAVLVAIVGAFIKGRLSGKASAETAQKAKEADAYAKHLQDIERAASAKPGSVSDDPFNRDR